MKSYAEIEKLVQALAVGRTVRLNKAFQRLNELSLKIKSETSTPADMIDHDQYGLIERIFIVRNSFRFEVNDIYATFIFTFDKNSVEQEIGYNTDTSLECLVFKFLGDDEVISIQDFEATGENSKKFIRKISEYIYGKVYQITSK